MLAGPIFSRELVTAPRRVQHYISRTTYVAVLFLLMATAWTVLTGTQQIRNVGDISRFGMLLFQILAPLQLTLLSFLGALTAASNVAQEKDKKTMVLLLMTRMANSELVLGKLFASLLDAFTMLLAALPLFVMITLFGGVSLAQIGRVYAVTFVAILAVGSLGNMIAFWREKTFQTLAITALAIVLWIGACEGLSVIAGDRMIGGLNGDTWATALSPLRAVLVAARPEFTDATLSPLSDPVAMFLIAGTSLSVVFSLIAIVRVRVWNPSREARVQQPEFSEQASIWGHTHDLAGADTLDAMRRREQADAARTGHVDARVRTVSQTSRPVWDNPILWREMCTWAYGRKVLIIRLAYFVFTLLAGAGLYWTIVSGAAGAYEQSAVSIPEAAKGLTPFFVISLVIVNALAVTSITNERDGAALDLLLVTDLSPREFIFGKILGVAYVTKEMIAAPLLMCVALWATGGLTFENLLYCLGGLVVMNLFVIMLGIHCGMIYSNSRTAIGMSLGTVFFLFLGVVTLLVLMISFSGSFQAQLGPFAGFIGGGALGLFVVLGLRNPSAAIALASGLLPLATFWAITSFMLGQPLTVFLTTTVAYGLTVAALMVPALSEFDFAMGRSKAGGE